MKDKLNNLVNILGCRIIVNDNDCEEDYFSVDFNPTFNSRKFYLYIPKPVMEIEIGSKMRIEAMEEIIDSKIKEIEDYNKDCEVKKRSEDALEIIKLFAKDNN